MTTKAWVVGGVLIVSVVALARGKPEPKRPGPVDSPVAVGKIAKIVCTSTVTYPAESPKDKEAVLGVKIFTRDKARDTPSTTAFLLDEYSGRADSGLRVFGGQRYNFEPVSGNTITFAFIAEEKASGSLELLKDGAATGRINQKEQITELSCFLQK